MPRFEPRTADLENCTAKANLLRGPSTPLTPSARQRSSERNEDTFFYPEPSFKHDSGNHTHQPPPTLDTQAPAADMCGFCHMRKHSGAHPLHAEKPLSPIEACESQDDFCPDTDMRVVDKQTSRCSISDEDASYRPRASLHRRRSLMNQEMLPPTGAQQLQNQEATEPLTDFSPQEEKDFTDFQRERKDAMSARMIQENEKRGERLGSEDGKGKGEFEKELKMLNGGWMDGSRHY